MALCNYGKSVELDRPSLAKASQAGQAPGPKQGSKLLLAFLKVRWALRSILILSSHLDVILGRQLHRRAEFVRFNTR